MSDPSPSDTRQEALSAAELAGFFEAACALFQAAPWQVADEDFLLQVDIPAVGLLGFCLSILGTEGPPRGLALYRSLADFELERAAVSVPEGEPLVLRHDGLYLLFEDAAQVAAAVREQVADAGWALPAPYTYPMVRRLERGQPALPGHADTRLMVLVARALAHLLSDQPEALRRAGDGGLRAAIGDGAGLEIILTAPHPGTAGLGNTARAQTLDDTANPYALPLTYDELRVLDAALLGLLLHRAMGLFCAVASGPVLVEVTSWMALIMPGLDLSSEARTEAVVPLLVRVYNHVIAELSEGRAHGLVPVSQDAAACEQWAQGFMTLCDNPQRLQLQDDALQALFEIHAVAGSPQVLAILADEGEAKQAARLTECRDVLADNLWYLYLHWQPARAGSARLLVPRRAP
jgi:hypothetical protein